MQEPLINTHTGWQRNLLWIGISDHDYEGGFQASYGSCSIWADFWRHEMHWLYLDKTTDGAVISWLVLQRTQI